MRSNKEIKKIEKMEIKKNILKNLREKHNMMI